MTWGFQPEVDVDQFLRKRDENSIFRSERMNDGTSADNAIIGHLLHIDVRVIESEDKKERKT